MRNCVLRAKCWVHILVLVAIGLSGCAGWVPYYDAATYRNLTDLKAETSLMMERLQTESDQKAILPTVQQVRLDVEKAYEYEHGKNGNTETIKQLEEIRKMIAGLANLLTTKDHLPPEYLAPKQKDLIRAFDIAIATESTKLKRE